ncbi:hypothetical protein Tel_09400 [Candidatus Tenderia electrophaga]|jgi:hypothetical protein|uniref:Uncharacterized protein n=1 Tax=Candidatus Tenderia electrophaga TaxID=1748243 RepID=A0A0S2TDZ6_9GAMM|nr:hypothetical protein Tel_09400 [Candidatus Tenderia electrophaga]
MKYLDMSPIRSKLKFLVQPLVLALATSLLFLSPALRDTQAAFELNFDPTTNNDHNYSSTGNDVNYSCGMSFGSDFNCGGGWGGGTDENGAHLDGTAAYQRMFSYGGKNYYHVIIGDSTTDDFYLEYMIEANSGWAEYNNDFAASASTGNNSSTSNREFNMINPYDSDSSRTGTGTGNPNRVIIRQVADDGTTRNEFLKDQFDRKPLITQTMSDPNPTEGITQEYTLDMRGKTYADNTPITENERTNRTILIGDTAANQGDYDDTGAVITPTFFREGSDSISAGAYTYSTGSGYGGSNGTYTYYQKDGVTVNPGGFQPVNKDYSVFCIQGQNVDWSGNGACTNGDGGGGGRGGGGWGGW